MGKGKKLLEVKFGFELAFSDRKKKGEEVLLYRFVILDLSDSSMLHRKKKHSHAYVLLSFDLLLCRGVNAMAPGIHVAWQLITMYQSEKTVSRLDRPTS